MGRSIFEPPLLLRVIRKKQQQLAEIDQDLENLPYDHPERFRLLERKVVLEKGIPALEVEYQDRTGDRQLGKGDLQAERTRTQSKLATRESIFSEDYRQVTYKGKTRRLTPQLAKILKILDQNKGREVTTEELHSKTGCSKKLYDSFRSKAGKPLWGHLVIVTSRGRYKLNPE
jgi:hypothetical protein